MKKITIISVAALIFLLACSTCAYFLRYLPIDNAWVFLLIGVAILIYSGILLALTHKMVAFRIISFLINAIALGFCIRSWYVYREFDNSLWVMMLVSLAAVIFLLLFYALLYIPYINQHFKVYILVFLVVSLVGYLIVMSATKTTYISTFGYYMVIATAFIFALCAHSDSFKELVWNIVLSTFSVFIVAIIIALIMLCGDGLDSFDFGGDASGLDFDSPKDQIVKKDKKDVTQIDVFENGKWL